MAELVVRDLDDDVREKLREMASAEGRSIEETARDILRDAVLGQPSASDGFGTRLAKRFSTCQLEEDLPELPRQLLEPPSFSE